jgi:hypothetical protein
MTSPQPHVSVMRSALLAASRVFIIPWPAILVAVLSGGVMMAAGYLLKTVGLGTATLVTIPGGVLILVAFRLAQATRGREPGRVEGAAGEGVSPEGVSPGSSTGRRCSNWRSSAS